MKRLIGVWLWPLLLFLLLSILATFPTAIHLRNFTVLATDSLLEGWTLRWDVHSFLGGPAALGQIWDANMFYPYSDTLAFSEHLLSTAMLLLPFVLLGRTPLAVANLGVLLTTALSGFGMYLLVTWLTRSRWAGVLAAIFFAIAPFRMGHIIQLHLLSTHWIPFAFLALSRLIKFGRNRDLVLLVLFTNLQFFSCVNYAPLVAVGLGMWGVVCLIGYRRFSLRMAVQFALFGIVTAAMNWPVLRLYQRVSDTMGVVRTLGDARVYGGALSNYTQPIANSLLYERWLGGEGLIDSASPGWVVFVAAVLAAVLVWRRCVSKTWRWWVLGLMLLALIGMAMSFGANEMALGPSLAPTLAKWLPYVHLYDMLPLLQGLRVPLRFALLTTLSLAILAGIGFTLLMDWLKPGRQLRWMIGLLLPVLVMIEHVPAPLPGVSVPYGGALQAWLADLPSGRVVLQLPYLLHTDRSYLELDRVYQSAGHWRTMVNGGSGFKPQWLVEAGKVFEAFPDAASLDLAQQIGVDYVVLQQDLYSPEAWGNVKSLLSGYLGAVSEVHNVGEDLVLRLDASSCEVPSGQVLLATDGGGIVELTNVAPVAFVADPAKTSVLSSAEGERFFLEPLFVLPGSAAELALPIPAGSDSWDAVLANLGREVRQGEAVVDPFAVPDLSALEWQPVDVPFANGMVLRSLSIGGSRRGCGVLLLALQWESVQAGADVVVTLVDRFGRIVGEQTPDVPSDGVSLHIFPLPGTLPPGSYTLFVQMLDADGNTVPAQSDDGALVQVLQGLPVVIRPAVTVVPEDGQRVGADLGNGVTLVGWAFRYTDLEAGQWFRFDLYWEAAKGIPGDFTVFTQLLGPDGQVWGQQDNPPKGGWYPTSLWLSNEVVKDEYAVQLDGAVPAGDYQLIVGMYDPGNGQRVPVVSGSGTGGDFVPVTTISVLGDDASP
jgi:hypothetical protein